MNFEVIHEAKSNNNPSGDAFFVSQDAPWLMLLADGLGSGDKAKYAANLAVYLFEEYCQGSSNRRTNIFPDLLINCHQKLKRSRGAALGGVILDNDNKQLFFCGVGNIRLVLAGNTRKCFCSQPGIVGAQLPRRITLKAVSTQAYSTGFLFSDGISLRSVLRTAENPFRPLSLLAEEINWLNGNSDDKTLIVFEINE